MVTGTEFGLPKELPCTALNVIFAGFAVSSEGVPTVIDTGKLTWLEGSIRNHDRDVGRYQLPVSQARRVHLYGKAGRRIVR